MTTLESRLRSLAGINVSSEWLLACQDHLASQGRNINDEDAILYEILHSDLRHCVASMSDENNNEVEPIHDHNPVTAAHTLLRNSIRSSNTTSSRSATISLNSFRLLVQIEELLDVSLNAETRLSHGPASLNAPSAVGAQKARCLKMLLCDGLVRARSESSNSSNCDVIVGMEVTPIPGISVNSRPGLKILLRAPIIIKFGVLMLHEGNTTVLGGFVPALVDVQKKALEMAQKAAMIGVDPTIKALINIDPNFSVAEDDNDEGEGESTDVAATAPTVTLPTNTTNHLHESHDSQVDHRNNYHNTNSSLTVQQSMRPTSRSQITNPLQASNASQRNNAVNSRNAPIRPSNPYVNSNNNSRSRTDRSNQQEQSSSLPFTPTPHPPSNQSSTVAINRTNPYRSGIGGAEPPGSGLRHSPVDLSSSSNEKIDSRALSTPCGNTRINSSNRSTFVPPGSGMKGSPLDLISPDNVSATEPTPLTSTPANNSEEHSFIVMSPTALTAPLSFSEFQCCLTHAARSQADYESQSHKTFIVPSKMKGNHRDFNIVRAAGSKTKKYEYTMTASFVGPNDADGVIECVKLSNSFLTPYFKVEAKSMRKMYREDKAKSNSLVTEGGRNILKDLKTLCAFEWKFYHQKWEDHLKEALGDAKIMMLITGRRT